MIRVEIKRLQYFSKSQTQLGGGFKHFLFSSLPGEMIQFDQYFSNGLKPPTSQVFRAV